MVNDVHSPSPLRTVDPPAICPCRLGTTPCQRNRLPLEVWKVVMTTASCALDDDPSGATGPPTRGHERERCLGHREGDLLEGEVAGRLVRRILRQPVQHGEAGGGAERQVGDRLTRLVATGHDLDDAEPIVLACGEPGEEPLRRRVRFQRPDDDVHTRQCCLDRGPRGVTGRVDRHAALAGVVHRVPHGWARPEHVTGDVLHPDDGGAELGQVRPGQRRRLVAQIEDHHVLEERQPFLRTHPRTPLTPRLGAPRTALASVTT